VNKVFEYIFLAHYIQYVLQQLVPAVRKLPNQLNLFNVPFYIVEFDILVSLPEDNTVAPVTLQSKSHFVQCRL
jgi:hypothetical protein